MSVLRAGAIAVAVTLVSELLWAVGVLPVVEEFVVDSWHDLRGVRTDLDVPVVIVAIDDASLDRLTDPMLFWGPHVATALDTLRDNGATTMGLDVLTKVSGESFFRDHGLHDLPISRSWDSPLRRNLFQGDVVLVAQRISGPKGDRLDLPLGEYLVLLRDARARLGLDNLPHDSDGVVRHWRPVVAAELVDSPAAPVHALSMALALHHLGLDPQARSWEVAGRSLAVDDHLERIVYRGPAGTWPSVPLWRLVEPGALRPHDAAMLDGAIAIMGATNSSTPDRLRSPFGQTLMPGVEVHANALGTLLSGKRYVELGQAGRTGFTFGFAWLAAVAAVRLRARSGVMGLVVLGLTTPAVGYGAFHLDVLVPIGTLLLTGGGVFSLAFLSRYLGEDRERRRLRSLFGRYVSDVVVDDILASPEGVRIGGERRQVTVLFSDIRGFTTLSEQLEPEEVVEMLNAWFAVACAPVIDQGGVVDKFIGDAVMAVFGAPVAHPDHAQRALEAALGLSVAADAFVEWMAERFEGRDLPPFDVGIGVHLGAAVVGNIGFEQRTEYTVIGDAVNVAARLEGLTKELQCRVLASEATVAACERPVRTGRTHALQVKGRVEPVRVVSVEGWSTP